MRITALIGGGALAVGLIVGWKANGWRLEARIADLQASYALAYAKAQKAARDKETALVDELVTIRKSKDDQIKNISSRLAATLNSLRDRPERPASGLPQNSTVGGVCTGAGLARPDGEFLAGYAADAARLQSAYETCVRSYNAARKALE